MHCEKDTGQCAEHQLILSKHTSHLFISQIFHAYLLLYFQLIMYKSSN